MPRIDSFRPALQAQASKVLGVRVDLGPIVVRTPGWVPAIELRDVVLRDADGRAALTLPRVLAAVSVRSLLALRPRFEQLLIEGADLQVRRDATGRWFVAGLPVPEDSAGDGSAAADWLLAQHEFAIRGGRLTWHDEQRGAPPLVLEQVDAVLRNGLRSHAFRLDATPPAADGARFTLRGEFQRPLFSRASRWSAWQGQAYASLPRAELDALRRHVALPLAAGSGSGALRAWVDVAGGTVQAATADVALWQVSATFAPGLKPLAFDRLVGRLDARRDGDWTHWSASRLRFDTRDGLRWPAGDLALSLQRPGDPGLLAPPGTAVSTAPATAGEFRADRLDLALMAAVAERTPLPPAVRAWLADTAPGGIVRGLSGRWEGPVEAPRRYDLRARVEGLSLAAGPAPVAAASQAMPLGRPGLRNATIALQARETGGDAQVDLANGTVSFPGLFDEPEIPLDRLAAQVAWRIGPAAAGQPPKLQVTVREAQFGNPDVQGRLQGSWETGADAARRWPGVLRLDGRLSDARAERVARYLPRGLPAETRQYVQHAVRGGRARSADFVVRGDLRDFPFTAPGAGDFRIDALLDDVTLAYVPSLPATGGQPAYVSPWPAFTKVSGLLQFDRAAMRIRDARANAGGFALSRVQGQIAHLGDASVLEVEGQGRGALADALRYVQATPVVDWTGPVLARATGGGSGDLRLALRLPLADTRQASVQGSVTLGGNDLRLAPDLPLLAAARGRVDFSDTGVTVVGGSARVLGGDVTFDGGSLPDGRLRFNAQGTATAEGLRRATDWPQLARAAQLLQGQTPYRLQLGFTDGEPELLLTSALQGMAIDLPEPLRKAAEVTLPLRLQTQLQPAAAAGAPRQDLLRVDLGTVLQAQYLRALEPGGARVLRGALALRQGAAREPQALPEQGVRALIDLDRLDTDAWQAAARRLAPTSSAALDPADAYLPGQIELNARELAFGARRLKRLHADLRRDGSAADAAWLVRLDADELNGRIEYRPARAGGPPARVIARLGRLSLPPAEADSVEALLERTDAQVPALDIVIDDFELRGKRLGKVEIEATHTAVTREWRLQKFNVTVPEARLTATGRWAPATAGARRRVVMDFALDLTDSGAFVERLGMGKALKGGRGELRGQIGWAGSPLAFDTPSLSGQMQVKLAAGQFLNAEPGAARLLGVLSLQALPRRLTLDFRDLFEAGFAFDSVEGDVRIERGVAAINPLRMRGVQAVVLMAGTADIDRETQDLRVVVVPEINAGTAALAYAAINPAVGLGTFLAQLFLRRPLMQASTREFHVTGPWADPVVTRVERAPGTPLPDMDAPAAAASTPPGNP